ncbi:MAG: phosphopyruvate hydratase [Candidatus Bathyarchaeota archaeon]|nr:MAG: phosphopyruvate hydratase [Candidatus Bathyarchaeota archaeon]
MGSKIQSVFAREIFSMRGHPGVEATVTTEDGASGVAIATAGVSIGKHEVQFAYDGEKRYQGKGVLKAVENVNKTIGPALKGMDATRQREIDETMIKLDGTPNKSKLGGNATASVSAAVLKAGAASLGIPLYQHIGGVNACTLPVPGVGAVVGSDRYGGGERAGGKPSYSLMAYGFKTYSDASYACWEVATAFDRLMQERHGLRTLSRAIRHAPIPRGIVKHDRELWDLMTDAIAEAGYSSRIGIQVDVAAGCYYDSKKDVFVGLFSEEDKTKEDLIELYKDMAANYPFVIMEDPLDEVDYEGHAILTKEIDIEVVGDDLFTTNVERLQRGIDVGACDAVLLKVNQIGTISEAFDLVQLAYRNGYGVMPCSSRGEGPDIGDYSVGLNTGHIRESGTGPSANRLLKIESELGSNAVFPGKAGLKTR